MTLDVPGRGVVGYHRVVEFNWPGRGSELVEFVFDDFFSDEEIIEHIASNCLSEHVLERKSLSDRVCPDIVVG